jgi:hypothetical protein
MPFHLVLKDGMELLDIAQGDGVGYLANYVLDFNQKLNVVPLKEKFTKKLVFLHGFKALSPKKYL